jgi:hypothetical protein
MRMTGDTFRSEEENGHGFAAVPRHNRRVCFRQELTESSKRVISGDALDYLDILWYRFF